MIGATSVTIPQQSQGELVLESFLNRMWAAQSNMEEPFRVTPGVLDGLNMIFSNGAVIGGIAGGPLGAGIGALIGAGVGMVGSLISRLF